MKEEKLQDKIEQYYKHWASQGRSDAGFILHLSEISTWIYTKLIPECHHHDTMHEYCHHIEYAKKAKELGIIQED